MSWGGWHKRHVHECLHQVFHLLDTNQVAFIDICGVSVGAIIAACIGIGMSTEEIHSILHQHISNGYTTGTWDHVHVDEITEFRGGDWYRPPEQYTSDKRR